MKLRERCEKLDKRQEDANFLSRYAFHADDRKLPIWVVGSLENFPAKIWAALTYVNIQLDPGCSSLSAKCPSPVSSLLKWYGHVPHFALVSC